MDEIRERELCAWERERERERERGEQVEMREKKLLKN